MGGFCGVISKEDCVCDLFYGTDYHSHLFEHDLSHFSGKVGLGVISDTDPQPLVMTSKLGTFAIVTVGLITNIEDIKNELFRNNCMQLQFSTTSGMVGPTEVVSALIATQDSIIDGLKYVQDKVKGSCSVLIMDSRADYG